MRPCTPWRILRRDMRHCQRKPDALLSRAVYRSLPRVPRRMRRRVHRTVVCGLQRMPELQACRDGCLRCEMRDWQRIQRGRCNKAWQRRVCRRCCLLPMQPASWSRSKRLQRVRFGHQRQRQMQNSVRLAGSCGRRRGLHVPHRSRGILQQSRRLQALPRAMQGHCRVHKL